MESSRTPPHPFLYFRKPIEKEARTSEKNKWETAVFLHDHPEIGSQEFQAVQKLTKVLEAYGFTIERGAGGQKTAFCATCDLNGASSTTIAYIAEYDALPEIGHACGHNLIAAMSAGAGIVLSRMKGLQGRINVIGTPDEEHGGGKIEMVRQGVFDDVDAAMMIHPSTQTVTRRKNLAAYTIVVEFHGKPAHAAGSPSEGINALDAMIHVFNGVGLLRQQLSDDVRIHGIITHGGAASNIIPDYTRGEFMVRASELMRSHQVLEQFKNCVKAAALATGAKETITVVDNFYEPLLTNNTLLDRFADKMRLLGVDISEQSPTEFGGSSDIGNVSQVVPAIHPSIRITEPGEEPAGHSREFARAARSEQARAAMLLGIQALAMCGADLLDNPEFLKEVKQEFQHNAVRGKKRRGFKT